MRVGLLRLALALSLVLGALFVPATVNAACSGSATFYQGANQTGVGTIRSWGNNWPTMGSWNDTISSMTWSFSQGCGVRVWQGSTYTGNSIRFCGSGTQNFGGAWNDNISSVSFVSCPT